MAIEINGAGTITGISAGGLNDGIITSAEIASGQVFPLNGIQFPATQVASTDANTLDDYEEGTWTPVATVQGGATGSYVTQVGRYTKVGNIVRVGFSIRVNKGTATGSLTISGLPFAFSGSNPQRGLASIDWYVPSGTAIVNCTAFGSNGTTILRVPAIVSANVDATANDFLWSYVATTVDISASLVYEV